MSLHKTINTCKSSNSNRDSSSVIVQYFRDKIGSGELQNGTKLQNEKALSLSFGSTIHNVRKALRILREEGLVYSRPKVGVFVSDQCLSPHGEDSFASIYPAGRHERLQFVTRSALTSQARVLDQAIHSFQAMEPGYEVSVRRLSEDEQFDQALAAASDMVESCAPFFYHCIREQAVDIGKYFSSILTVSDTDSHSVPFCYSTTYVCYRRKLLESLGFECPSWRSYEEQVEYLEAVTASIQAHGLAVPGTSFSPLELLDSALPRILADFRDPLVDADEFVDRYSAVMEACTRYWRHYQISFPRQAQWHINDFVSGKTPLFFTSSATVLQFRELYPELDIEAYPYLSVEGRLPRLTVPLSIMRQTSHLVECARFLREMQREPIQRGMADLGYIPITEDCYEALPESSRRFSGAEPFFLISADDFYLTLNVLNVEVWNIILFDKPLEEALRDSLVFARAYLDFQMDVNGCKNRAEHGRLYL